MNIVLDTNAVLAAAHFQDPAVQPLWRQVRDGHLAWHATAAMRDELRHVALRLHGTEPPWLAPTLALARPATPPAAAPAFRLHCRDPADQMFIDLALALAPARLYSRDKALLALARRAGPLGVQILKPEAASAPG